MKRVASELVPMHYTEYLRLTIGDHGFNKLEYHALVVEDTTKLLDGGFFLQGGKDENVSNSLSFLLYYWLI
jgi:hypothetical protein